ncbi:hypothetical protein BCD67_04065 [Oscillatoriales cyanobacterium USR001]|nr:hypothetical protein BCD67_04065 [Oscillatoriales cyanobacterium USR001]
MWTPGERLRNRPYQIESLLGQGGFGLTYKARHLPLNHLVVIKTPNANLQNDPEYPKFLQRFIKEGQTLAQLSQKAHPSIVRVNDLFEEEAIYCLVMDLIVGESLFECVQKQGILPEPEAIEIICQIGDALTIVHQMGMVHRDAHPGNIMLRKGTPAVLIDFGIAGEILPTIFSYEHPANRSFAPYEQHLDGSREPTVDIYCLAASLYYTLTGQVPTNSLKRKLQDAPLVPPNKRNSQISDSINYAIMKGLALEAKDRPQTMQDFMTLIQPSQPIIVSPPPPKQQILNPSETMQLISAKGIDYRRLEAFLASGNWKDADQETAKKMLEIAGREKEGWVKVSDIDRFPCEDLCTIDRLWSKYSNGRFGFSVQKRVYESLGETQNYDKKTWEEFGELVGWRVNNAWLWCNDIQFTPDAPIAHLPSFSGCVGVGVWVFGLGRGVVRGKCVVRLYFHLENCKL